jgi:cytoskeletal protein CcmA (bactofilin family)
VAIRDLRTRTRPVAAASETKRTTFIDAGCELSGTLRFKDDVQIDGRVEGEIQAEQAVRIGESATIEADLRAESVEVHGTVHGDIHVRRKTVLHKSAEVRGEIHTAGIVVEEGARVRGTIVIGGDEPKPAQGPDSPST